MEFFKYNNKALKEEYKKGNITTLYYFKEKQAVAKYIFNQKIKYYEDKLKENKKQLKKLSKK